MSTYPQHGQAAPLWKEALSASYRRGGKFLWFLVKMVLPWYVASELLMISGALDYISGFLKPLMGLWGLPPEAAAVLLAGMLVNLYAAAAVAAPLALTWQQVSVLGLTLGICHSLVVETVIVRELTPRYRALAVLRLVLGLGAGWALALVLC